MSQFPCTRAVRSCAAAVPLMAAALTVVVSVVVSVAASTASAADTYAVKLHRAVKVGQEFTVTCKADVSQGAKVTVNGKAAPDRDMKFTAELAGTTKVEAVNDQGEPTKLTLTIDKLTKDGADVLPAGTVVVAEHAGEKPTFTVNGSDVEADQAAVLEAVVDVDRPKPGPTDDQTLGTDKPQSVGATWDGDAAQVAKAMKDQAHLPIAADHLTVSSKLVEVKAVGGTPSEVVESTISSTGDVFEPGSVSQGLTVTDGSFGGTVTQTTPVDPSLPTESSDQKMKLVITGTATPNGMNVKADITVERHVHRTMAAKK